MPTELRRWLRLHAATLDIDMSEVVCQALEVRRRGERRKKS